MKGNRELLRRAVENVLRNAIRYSPAHGTIEVLSSREDSRVAEISVRDFGPGDSGRCAAAAIRPFFPCG